MKESIEKAIAFLEKIPVSGVNAILMGDALKELLMAKEEAIKAEKGEE